MSAARGERRARGGPGALPRGPLGARAFFGDPLGFVRRVDGDEGGDAGRTALLRFRAPHGEYVLVRDPALAWEVLVTGAAGFRPGKWKHRARRFAGPVLNTLDGEPHRSRRSVMQPAFARARIDAAAPRAIERARELLGRAGELRRGDHVTGDPVPSVTESGRGADFVTLDRPERADFDRCSIVIAGDVLLGVDLAPVAPRLAPALREVMAALPRLTPPLAWTRGGRALATAHGLLRGPIAAAGPDSLPGLLRVAGMDDRAIAGEVLAVMLAAVDEPPSALAAAMEFLDQHPEERRALAAELRAAPPRGATDLRSLLRLRAIVDETLRLAPPARHIDRCPVHDVVLAGEPVAAGTTVIVSPLVAHRDQRVFDRPDDFDPSRWTAAERPQRGAFVPFGAGVHTCIGEGLARLTIAASLAAVVR